MFGLVAVLGLAALNFSWQLGSSSLYVDEVLSINTSLAPLGRLLGTVQALQLSPPGFYLLQHEWLYHTTSHLEWAARLPSAVCGVALVGAIFWLARLVSGRSVVALGAAVLAALSPFLLQFAQLAQNYIFAALAVTLAVCATLRSERSSEYRRRWLAAALLAAVGALYAHYTAALILAPLCIRVALTGSFSVRERLAFVGVFAAAGAALIPVFLSQNSVFSARSGVAGVADLSVTSASRVMAGPFAGRVDPLRAISVAVVLLSLLTLLVRFLRNPPRFGQRGSGFVAVLGFGEPLALLVLSALGHRVALGRYAAVAIPMLIVGVTMAIASLPAPVATLVALAALVVSAVGLADSHRPSGFYADARGVTRYLDAVGGSDSVVTPDSPGITLPLQYYADHQASQRRTFAVFGSAQASNLVARHRRMWIVLDLSGTHASLAQLAIYETRLANAVGYRISHPRIFSAVVPLAVTLWEPRHSTLGR